METFLKRILVLFKGPLLQTSSDVCSGFPLTWPLAVNDKFLRLISKWHTCWLFGVHHGRPILLPPTFWIRDSTQAWISTQNIALTVWYFNQLNYRDWLQLEWTFKNLIWDQLKIKFLLVSEISLGMLHPINCQKLLLHKITSPRNIIETLGTAQSISLQRTGSN